MLTNRKGFKRGNCFLKVLAFFTYSNKSRAYYRVKIGTSVQTKVEVILCCQYLESSTNQEEMFAFARLHDKVATNAVRQKRCSSDGPTTDQSIHKCF